MYALVFPGQGSQSMGMLSAWAQANPTILETFQEASDALGYDLWQLVQSGPEETLNQTQFTQPALLTAGVAIFRAFMAKAKQAPAYLAGHSLGEYTALVCSDVISLAEGVKLVQMRGRFMQAAVPVGQGAMAAIVGLTANQVEALCVETRMEKEQLVAPANYNADAQIVIAGEANAVDTAIEKALQSGAKIAKKLIMSVPSHCELMQPAAQELASYIQSLAFNAPRIPILHNTDVATHTEPMEIKAALVSQLALPVRWVETMQMLTKLNIKNIYECGPGKVLTGLAKRIDSAPPAKSMNTPEEGLIVINEVNA